MTFKTADMIGAGLIVAVASGLYIAGVRPLQQAYADTVSLKTDLWLSKNKLAEREVSEERTTSTADSLTERLERLDVRLLGLEQMNARLSRLTAIAEDAGMKLEGVRPGADAESDRYRAIEITLIGRVDYVQAGNFLQLLREELADIGLSSIRYERIMEGETPSGRLHLTMIWYASPAGPAGRSG